MSTLHNVFIFTGLHHYKKVKHVNKKGHSLIRKYSNKQSKCIEVSVQLHPAVSTLNINSIW